MKCPHCDAPVLDGWKFCGHCGLSLSSNDCTSCQFSNPLENRFCGNCGTPLQTAAPPASTPAPQPAVSESLERYQVPERRQMTVMFCDMVGSTALSVRTDPENLREIIRIYHECCVPVIARFTGEVTRYMGDGIFARFGYPQAHEDDAERAVYAGLEILANVAALGPLNITAPPFMMQVRIGVATGLVVAGDIIGKGPAEEDAIIGETPNLAARLQALAEPGSLLISSTTRQLVSGVFEFEELGKHHLRGFSVPVPVVRVTGLSNIESRFDAARTGEFTTLVGRDEELDLLMRRWERSRSAEGQVVLLAGEAGIGKSRMTQELRTRLDREPHYRLRYQCSPFHANTALYPITVQLARAIKVEQLDTDDERLDALVQFMRPWCSELDETVPLFAELLSISTRGRYPQIELSPQQKKEKTLEALLELVDVNAAKEPVLLIFEDAHWIDPTSQEFLDALVARCEEQRVLAVVTFRPKEYTVSWSGLAQVTQLSLNRLSRRHGAQLTARAAARGLLSEEMIEQIVQRTDGVPLYIEEFVKMLAEANSARPADGQHDDDQVRAVLSIPSSLRDALEARLDHLGRDKEVAQLAAALGRSFSYELIGASSHFEPQFLEQALSKMVTAELLYRRGRTFTFKHALIQEAAYGSLLREQREQIHRAAAQALQADERAEPELLAHHFSNAGCWLEAIEYWHRAGMTSLSQSANLEAVAHLRKGLEAVPALAEDQRDNKQLMLKLALGSALTALKGYGSPEVERHYVDARELSQRVGDRNGLFQALRGLQSCYLIRGPLSTARTMSEELLELADASGDNAHIVEANRRLGWCQFCLGDMRSGRKHLLRALELYRPQLSAEHIVSYGADPKVIAHANLAWLEWFVGDPSQALEHSAQALDYARKIDHSFSRAYALCMSAAVQQSRGDVNATKVLAHEVVGLANTKGFAYWTAWGTVIEAWAESEQDRDQQSLAKLREGLASYRGTSSELFRPYNLYLLADACTKSGLFKEALSLLDEANSSASKTEVAFFQAEILRLRGQLLQASGGHEAMAEHEYQQAINIAQQQGARSIELRATISLCELLRDQGRAGEAAPRLTEIVDSFAPQSESTDLTLARKLLAALT